MAHAGRTEIAKILLQNQHIDVDLETPTNRQTPLIAACGGANYEMVKLLLDAGAEVNKPNNFNQTPLMMTVFRLLEEYSSFEIRRICMRTMELLVHKGADVNWIVDKDEGYTLLHSLCSCPIKMSKAEKQINYDIIRFLIDNGADIHMRAFSGKRPEDLVTGHCSMTAILDLIIKRKELCTAHHEGKENRRQELHHKRRHEGHFREMFSDLCESNATGSYQSGSNSVSRVRIKKFEETERLAQQFLSVNALKKK